MNTNGELHQDASCKRGSPIYMHRVKNFGVFCKAWKPRNIVGGRLELDSSNESAECFYGGGVVFRRLNKICYHVLHALQIKKCCLFINVYVSFSGVAAQVHHLSQNVSSSRAETCLLGTSVETLDI